MENKIRFFDANNNYILGFRVDPTKDVVKVASEWMPKLGATTYVVEKVPATLFPASLD